ncbi:NADPH2:quinone reductase [Variovorax sp. OAS795]|uniref:quinone oxidoreductase family protein n=1 Tax=Variovorax sp. OAS795 TaxID=3034231 RepID=UPI003391A112
MKAIVLEAHGGPEQLKLKDVDCPTPGTGEVLVEVAAAGVNFMDTGTRRGHPGGRTDLPLTPGVEGAGKVISLGKEVTSFKVDDRVAWYFAWGSYAEQVIVPATQLVPLPDDIAYETAAGLMMQGLTASNLVFESHMLRPGETALIHAAAGGVGLLLTQMVRVLGGRVIGRVSSAEKIAAAKAAGASHVIVDRSGNFAAELLRLTSNVGVQVVYDGSGAETFRNSLAVVDFHGTLALYGPLFDEPMPPFTVWDIPKSIKVTYPVVLDHCRTHERLVRNASRLFDWVRAGDLTVSIGKRYPLADAASAHRDIESRRTTGKLLLLPRP